MGRGEEPIHCGYQGISVVLKCWNLWTSTKNSTQLFPSAVFPVVPRLPRLQDGAAPCAVKGPQILVWFYLFTLTIALLRSNGYTGWAFKDTLIQDIWISKLDWVFCTVPPWGIWPTGQRLSLCFYCKDIMEHIQSLLELRMAHQKNVKTVTQHYSSNWPCAKTRSTSKNATLEALNVNLLSCSVYLISNIFWCWSLDSCFVHVIGNGKHHNQCSLFSI